MNMKDAVITPGKVAADPETGVMDEITPPTYNPPLVCSEAGLVQCIGAAGFKVLVGSESSRNSAFYSKYTDKRYLFSSYESDLFIDELQEVGKSLDYKPVLMSYDDRLILNLSRNREKLLSYYRFLLPGKVMVEELLDKVRFIRLADAYDLPVPRSVVVSSAEELYEVVSDIQKPYLVKPVYRHHWFHPEFRKIVGRYKKAFVVNTLDELREFYEKIAKIDTRVIVQEYIEGPDENMYDVNFYIDESFNIRGAILAQKLRVYPPVTGYGCHVKSIRDDRIMDLSVKIAEKLSLTGLVNIQFKKDVRTGEIKLIEIHPRTSIFDIIGLRSGVNLAALYYKDLTGMPLPEHQLAAEGVGFYNLNRELRWFLKYPKKLPVELSGYFGKKILEGITIRDVRPAFVSLKWTAADLYNGMLKRS